MGRKENDAIRQCTAETAPSDSSVDRSTTGSHRPTLTNDEGREIPADYRVGWNARSVGLACVSWKQSSGGDKQGMDVNATSDVLAHKLMSITNSPVCALDWLESHLSHNNSEYLKMSERIVDSDTDPESTLCIVSKPWESFKDDVLTAAEQFDSGAQAGPDTLSFSDPGEIARILTEKRLEMIRSIMEEPPDSIRALAKRLDRNPREVHEDVHLFKDYGILELEDAGRAKRPVIPYDEIKIEVSLKPGDESDNEEVAVAP